MDRLSPQSQSGSKWIHGEVMFFFFVSEAATLKWTHGEVAVFGSTVYKIFALKSQTKIAHSARFARSMCKKNSNNYAL